MWRKNYFHCPRASRTEYNKVAWGGQTSTTLYNILQNKRNVSYNICLVKKFDSDQTLYNKIQHDTTRYNKVAKRVQQSCMMLYEMLHSFGRGFREEFLEFLPLISTTGEHIAGAILKAIVNLGLDISSVRDQGYDGYSASHHEKKFTESSLGLLFWSLS